MKKYDVISLGEILMRLSPPGNEFLSRNGMLEKQIGGAELNVVSGLSLLGLKTALISKIPNHSIGKFARNEMKTLLISDEYLLIDNDDDARVGIYYYQDGAYPRKPKLIYDRKNTSMLKLNIDDLPESMFKNTKWFHTTGITLALSPEIRDFTKKLIKKFKDAGTKISFDVNFRSNLWTGEEARKYIEELLPSIDMFFCSKSTAELTFDKHGTLEEIMKSFCDEYPIQYIAATNRIVHSPRKHSFGSMFYDAKKKKFYDEEYYEDIEVVNRIGSGDAYISGALYGLIQYKGDCQKALEYGNAMAASKITVKKDLHLIDLKDIDDIIKAHKTNDTSEMVR